ALACLVSGFAAAATGLWQRYGGQPHPEADNRHFGRGPYVTIDATPTAELLGRLADIVRQLRDAALSEGWQVNWAVFDGLLAGAATAMRAGNLKDAAAGHLRAISSMMAQLREQRTASSDSGVFSV
ncbi:MAG: hypothetical protein LLG00_02310, partial [Planctomycetaceae bacterium]|nr:hypothetical protein [Planctomycetaceae bacterium]